MPFNHLTENQISQLVQQGCTATDWKSVTIADTAMLQRINHIHCIGAVQIGNQEGSCLVDNVELPCGLYSVTLNNCTIGDHVRIANIGSVISNYSIGDNVVIQDVASLTAESDSSFGNGIELETINEGGGRGVRILNDLTAQIAYMQGMMKHNPEFSSKLASLIEIKINGSKPGKGIIADHAAVLHCGPLTNVCIGPYASIVGVKQLENGTVNSCKEHPTQMGNGVIARHFIVSEGATIDSGALVDKCFIGQGVKMGKQYSAENSLFFANCEAFHGEAVSLFAGPYTVTHHKSTLLIAGIFSFYNAGSGTNQSNHMYKLGPVHQGVLERGSKTGSFSYLLFEAHIGAFSVVIGKHYSNISTPNLPFSYIFEEEGKSKIVPGMNLGTIGLVRDGEKWPKRDNRKTLNKRDLIIFDVFTPYTVEKMCRGRDELIELNNAAPKEKSTIPCGGGFLSRLHLEKGAKVYEQAITRYLNGKIAERLMESLKKENSWQRAIAALAPASPLKYSEEWTDISGLIVPRERLLALEQGVMDSTISTYEILLDSLQSMIQTYQEDEWNYIYDTYRKEHGLSLEAFTKQQAEELVLSWEKSASSLQSIILDDSKKEYGATAHIGYGIDRTEEEAGKDFESVRGTAESNGVVQKMAQEVKKILQAKEEFLAAIHQSAE
ncbi:MAG: DUF4954 family protein [bacterium]